METTEFYGENLYRVLFKVRLGQDAYLNELALKLCSNTRFKTDGSYLCPEVCDIDYLDFSKLENVLNATSGIFYVEENKEALSQLENELIGCKGNFQKSISGRFKFHFSGMIHYCKVPYLNDYKGLELETLPLEIEKSERK